MPEDRLHALDAVRAFALLSGIVLHATMSFLPGFAVVGWPIVDSSPSLTLGLTLYVLHIFRMTTFFLLAGFFGHLLFHRRGLRAFVRDRARRIVIPFVCGWGLLLPLIGAALVWGGLKSGVNPPPPSPSGRLAIPLTHLWFLYYLIWMYAIVLSARAVLARFDEGGGLRARADVLVGGLLGRWWAPIVLAFPLWASLCTRRDWVMWMGIPTPDQSLIPGLPSMIGFGTAFGLGWLLHRQPRLLDVWRERWAMHGVFAVALTAAALGLAGPIPEFTPAARDWTTVAYAACYTVAIWHWTFAVIGAAMRFLPEASDARRYVSDSSYWLYLAHVPVVFFMQALVMQWTWHWSVKFPFIVAASLSVLFASYHYAVRPTFLGELLNGRRYPRRARSAPGAFELG